MFARAILFTCVLSSLFMALHFLKTISYSSALSVTVYTVGWVAPPKMFFNCVEFKQEPNELSSFALGFNGPEF